MFRSTFAGDLSRPLVIRIEASGGEAGYMAINVHAVYETLLLRFGGYVNELSFSFNCSFDFQGVMMDFRQE